MPIMTVLLVVLLLTLLLFVVAFDICVSLPSLLPALASLDYAMGGLNVSCWAWNWAYLD